MLEKKADFILLLRGETKVEVKDDFFSSEKKAASRNYNKKISSMCMHHLRTIYAVCNPFSLAIYFFNFIIHFSPVFASFFLLLPCSLMRV
jgi:hypothetical protein